ncbi:histone-lysine N-methyltransferase SETDB2 [Spea bombifrons]|uniref:histone-lysine N-methyltransferase SETDB2 n=1 Tax=Spea bombifrons TaxID=233779 RepID=UPI00234A7E48|nr:histone-lysine N-methyltransferase SETDB2 [Spea bombifrons]
MTLLSRIRDWKDPAQLSQHISADEAKQFWKDRQEDGKLDLMFEEVQNKVQLLWRRIKDGSATEQEYLTAVVFVTYADLDDPEAPQCDINPENEDDKSALPRTEKPCLDISAKNETGDSDSGCCNVVLPPPVNTVTFIEHACGMSCISGVNPYFSKKDNPLKLPLLCQFQRRHAKTDCISRPINVIYKSPCGKSLRDFEELRSYLFQTKCRFLFLDNFSFNTYVQLERRLCYGEAFAHDPDISKDAETVPVSFSNEIDSTRPAHFKYRKSSWPRGYSISNFIDTFIECCDCTDGCLDITKCACLQLTARANNEKVDTMAEPVTHGYKHKRLPAPVSTGLYECNVACKCDSKLCQNRVVQHGIQVRLQVFKTKDKGWGVRCLDDIDKGTFVCTFAGRLLVRSLDTNSNSIPGDAGTSDNNVDESEPTVSSSVPAIKRKRRVSHSDSEITRTHSAPYSCPKLGRVPFLSSSQTEIAQIKNKSGGRPLDFMSIKRPKTKTSILQKRRRQLLEQGSCTVQHSSEDECSVVPSPKPKIVCTGRSSEEEANDPSRVAESTKEKSDEADFGFVSEDSNSSTLSGVNPLELSACQDQDEKNKASFIPSFSPEANYEENTYFLDASEEGNVGRFLNHSCSPNLFIQHVFVETHRKGFPWVAFFTKRHVKAGQELTWDYNYSTCTSPKKEIPCMCDQQSCKNIII